MPEDLLNVFGSFSEVSLDCIEKQNEEIEQLEKENQQLEKENKKYKRLIENLKELTLYEYELDYDYEENPIDDYRIFDMNYYIDNWFKIEEIEEKEVE